MDNQKMGVFIALRRKDLGLTQQALAEKLHVTNKAVSKWETGRGFPDVGSLEQLATALEVTVLELLHGERMQTESVSVETARETVEQVIRTVKQTEQQEALYSLVTLLAVPLVICLMWILKVPGTRHLLLRHLPWIFGSIGVVATLRALWQWSQKSAILRSLLSATAVTIGLFSISAVIMALLLFCMMISLR